MADKVFSGCVVLEDRIVENGYVLVSGGRVEAVGEGAPPAGEAYGGAGYFVLPGAIDAQVHSRTQKDQEDFIWSTRAAAAGGVTTIVDMPYDDGALIATPERFRAKRDGASEQARVDFALYATLHPAETDIPGRIAGLVAEGASSFKFSTFGTHPERFPRIPPQTLAAFFQALAPYDLIAGVHNEDHEMVVAALNQVKAAGIDDYRGHALSRPPLTEVLATSQVYEIGHATGCPAHIVHCSVGRGYELAARYRAEGDRATIEACIHYLVLTEEDDVRRLGGFAKINPPIRNRAAVDDLWRHLAAGNITVVSTDHVSWSRDRKNAPDMLANASGAPGLEALYGLLLRGLEQRGLPFTWAAKLLAANPAKLFRLSDAKGALAVGRDADIALVRRDPHTYRAGASGHNVVDWSAYDGIDMPYRVVGTFLRGETVFDGTQVAAPGTGRFLRPRHTEAARQAVA